MDDIMNNKCNKTIISNDEIKEIHNRIEEDISKKNYTKTPIIVGNAAFHVTEYDNQTNEYQISYVDLGICEEKIKGKYEIQEKNP